MSDSEPYERSLLLVDDNPADVMLAPRAFAMHSELRDVTVLSSGQDALYALFSPRTTLSLPAGRAGSVSSCSI